MGVQQDYDQSKVASTKWKAANDDVKHTGTEEIALKDRNATKTTASVILVGDLTERYTVPIGTKLDSLWTGNRPLGAYTLRNKKNGWMVSAKKHVVTEDMVIATKLIV